MGKLKTEIAETDKKIKTLIAELNPLRNEVDKIIKRVWEQSEEAIDVNGVVLNEANIRARVEKLADDIIEHFPNENPVIVGLLDGATPLASMLCEALTRKDYEFKYSPRTASSYGDNLTSGDVTTGSLPKEPLYGRTVIILDDVCETGKTLLKVANDFEDAYAKKVVLMVLVDKKQDRPLGCDPHYVGFELTDKAFIIGLGLDYLRGLRNKLTIRSVIPESLPKGEEKDLIAKKNTIEKEIEALITHKEQTKKQLAAKRSIFTSPESAPMPVEKSTHSMQV